MYLDLLAALDLRPHTLLLIFLEIISVSAGAGQEREADTLRGELRDQVRAAISRPRRCRDGEGPRISENGFALGR